MKMSAAPTVFISVPKYVAITPMGTLTKIRPAPVNMSALSPASTDYASSCGSVNEEDAPRGKKRRLDHLTWDEKIQRKKLKNRVAAQTSRDRKKARTEEMEMELRELNDKTDLLNNKCESLQAINDALLEKNHKLDTELETLRQQLTQLKQEQQKLREQSKTQNTVATCTGCESILNGSAVSKYTDPLQQGSINSDSQSIQEQQQQQQQYTQQGMKKTQTLAALWRIVALCLLYKTSVCLTKNSMPESLKSSQKVCLPISQQTWRQAIERAMQLLPKLQATQSDCLDQWWGPQQSAWNPANIAAQQTQQKLAA